MKKFKKFFAVILSLAMVLGMSLTAFAANGSSSDTADVTIKGLVGDPKVTLVRIAAGNYQGEGKNAFVKYTWAAGVPADTVKALEEGNDVSSTDITAIVNVIKANNLGEIKDLNGATINDTGIVSETQTTGEVYKATVKAGAYIALIESSVVEENGEKTTYVYNPILLSASYDANGNFAGGSIDAGKDLYGTDSVAKRSEATVKKTLDEKTPTDPTIPDDANDEHDKYTASVGDVLNYTITPTIPVYPANAVNKTLFVSDKMSDGLSFDESSLTINVGTTAVHPENGVFTYEGKAIATVDTARVSNGFYLNFNYDNIVNDQRVPFDITVTYSARVNENAVVGKDGNDNDAKMYYANNPNEGTTFVPDDTNPTPDNADGVTKEEDKKTVYTYQIAFEKVDDNKNPLSGAKFGIYTDEKCENLFDIVVTNEAGVAVSTSVKAGKYWIREIEAPDGYSLNDEIFPITVDWSNATGSITRTEITETNYKYTTNPDEAATQPAQSVGWIYEGVFYNSAEKPHEDAQEAYVKEMTTTTTATETVTEGNAGDGTVITLKGDSAIKNTKLTSLPSTGGIGTTIFTIGGCIIMVVAAALFFASRRKSAK